MSRRILMAGSVTLILLAALGMALSLTSWLGKEAGSTISTKLIPRHEDTIQVVSGMLPSFSIDDLVRHSDSIVIGRVTEILPSKQEREVPGMSIIYTDVIVQADRYLYGEPKSKRIGIRVWGGRLGDTIMLAEDAPMFTLGEETLVFLFRPPYQLESTPEGIELLAYYKVTGSTLGKYAYEDGTATDGAGRQVSISTIEKKIAAIRQEG